MGSFATSINENCRNRSLTWARFPSTWTTWHWGWKQIVGCVQAKRSRQVGRNDRPLLGYMHPHFSWDELWRLSRDGVSSFIMESSQLRERELAWEREWGYSKESVRLRRRISTTPPLNITNKTLRSWPILKSFFEALNGDIKSNCKVWLVIFWVLVWVNLAESCISEMFILWFECKIGIESYRKVLTSGKRVIGP